MHYRSIKWFMHGLMQEINPFMIWRYWGLNSTFKKLPSRKLDLIIWKIRVTHLEVAENLYYDVPRLYGCSQQGRLLPTFPESKTINKAKNTLLMRDCTLRKMSKRVNQYYIGVFAWQFCQPVKLTPASCQR